MSEASSYRQILRSSSIVGGASVIGILLSLFRVKVAAMVLGPAGIGLIGLLQNLISTAAAVSSLGLGTVGTRQVVDAIARQSLEDEASARRALFWGATVLSVAGGASVWALRTSLSTHLLGDPIYSDEVGWLALGVGFTVAAGSQSALLIGLRRVGDVARVGLWSSLLATIVSVSALWLWGKAGLMIFVLASPLIILIVGYVYVVRLKMRGAPRSTMLELYKQWRVMLPLGVAFMASGVVATAGQLAVRSMVQSDGGVESVGQFQAAWAISMTYLGLVLGAMGTDYFPRLTAVINDHQSVNRLVNEQTEIALLLAGPALLGMLALAPWVVELLYSSDFAEAAKILRWQVVGDVLKIASWPLGFILLSAGAGRTFMTTESISIGVFALLVWLGLPYIGVQATAVGFVGMYIVSLPLMHWLARRRTGFAWTNRVLILIGTLTTVTLFTSILVSWLPQLGLVVGLTAAGCFAAYGFDRISDLTNIRGALAEPRQNARTLLKMLVARIKR